MFHLSCLGSRMRRRITVKSSGNGNQEAFLRRTSRKNDRSRSSPKKESLGAEQSDWEPLEEWEDLPGLEETEEETEALGGEPSIDDPIRIYLMQMGEIPLLSRKEEITAARQIERSRERFRLTMLATDYKIGRAHV